MYEHPYLSQQITRFDREQLERAAEQRRFLIEHADQIVPRQPGVLRRVFSRLIAPRRASNRRTGDSGAATGAVARGAATPCDPIPAR